MDNSKIILFQLQVDKMVSKLRQFSSDIGYNDCSWTWGQNLCSIF